MSGNHPNYRLIKIGQNTKKSPGKPSANGGVKNSQMSIIIIMMIIIIVMRTRTLLETKLYSRNLIKGINTWAVPLVRYSRSLLKWMTEEIQ